MQLALLQEDVASSPSGVEAWEGAGTRDQPPGGQESSAGFRLRFRDDPMGATHSTQGEATGFQLTRVVADEHPFTDEGVVHIYDQWIAAGVPWPTALNLPRIEPKEIIHPSARPFLTDRVQEILERLKPLLKREAHRNFIPVSKIEVSGFVDPEEDIEEVVITQWVRVPVQEALDYWDRLGAALEVWIDSLPAQLTRVAIERISVEVRWGIDSTTT